MKTTHTLHLLLCCFLLISSNLINAQCHIDDWTALKALYESTDGDNWWNNDGWEVVKNDEPPLDCSLGNLAGIWLNGNERVSSLSREINMLKGSIPPQLGKLTYLEHLSLSRNSLSGGIPPELGELKNLKKLYLASNNLNGKIPPELGKLNNLVELKLNLNYFKMSIPTEFGNLSKLKVLYLYYNNLSGSIPAELGDLTNLNDLKINNNKLNGNIPPELGNLINLTNLELYENQLDGNIPPELGNLAKLINLELYDNLLTGNIPPELGKLTNLGNLELSSNKLNGSVPPELGNLSNLSYLKLNGNQLNGSIPHEIEKLNELEVLKLNKNKINGVIPLELGNLSNLYFLELSENELNGVIPPELGNLNKMQYLSLNDNKLSGKIPLEIGSMYNLLGLDLSSNKLNGNIPVELGSLTDLNYLILSNNQLNGVIPYLNPMGSFHELNFDIRFNNYTCNEIKSFNYDDFEYDDEGGILFAPFLFYTPQNYYQDTTKTFLVDNSEEAITLGSSFSQLGNFTYQWHIDENPIDGAIDSILHLNSIQFEDVGNYTLHITDDTCIEGLQYISDPISVRRTDLEGCTDINSCNYNEFAFIDDGSCEYLWCDTMTNPIKIRTTNETILSDTQIKFDILIDSLDLDYSADGLTFNLDTRGNYRIESIEVANPILSIAEVDVSKLYKNTLSINRIDNQRLASDEPILSAIACILVEDIPSDETTCSHFVISGGTELASGHFIDFDNVYIDIPFSDCSPYGNYGAEGKNWLPLVLTITPQNCNTQTSGFAEIKILEDGQSPFAYIWKDELGTIILQATSEENPIKVPDLNAGNYELTVFDRSEKKTTMKTCIPLVSSLNGNENCNTHCVDYVTIPDGEITGMHAAKKEIEIKGFVGKNETVEFNICE